MVGLTGDMLEILHWTEPGRFERLGHPVSMTADQAAIGDGRIVTSQGSRLRSYEFTGEERSPLRQVGELDPKFEHCELVTPTMYGPYCRPGPYSMLDIHGDIVLASPFWPALPPLDGPLVYRLEETTDFDLLGVLDTARPWHRQTKQGAALPAPIPLRFDYRQRGHRLAPMTWIVGWLEPRGEDVFVVSWDTLERRAAAARFDEPALDTLALPGARSLAARIDREDDIFLVVASAPHDPAHGPAPEGPSTGPGLHLVAVAGEGGMERIGFLPLPAPVRDIAAAGDRVYVAVGDAGLLAYELEDETSAASDRR